MLRETHPAGRSLSEMARLLAPLCERHGVAKLEVFGSRATGEARSDSDVDLLVTFLPGTRLGLDFFALHDELEAILGSKVDLLTRRSVELDPNPIRRRSILESARDLYAA
jgi:predicted nucleotidyltransferase